jgi:anthranilate phosphoribosyltransferase
MIREAIAAVAACKDLTEAEASEVTNEIMQGEATPSQIAAFLTALRMKGETVDEITGMARTMRARALRIDVEGDLLDVVSTGGGSFDPLNISTAAALVCAAAGVRVAKHGNRGFTSASGAADVLEALGAKIDLEPEQVKRCIEETGFGFLFAQSFHPAMRFAGPTRREIGLRTVFNALGPLTNPAGAQFQLLGVGDAALAPKIAQVIARLGTGRAFVVHSEDGLDEISLGAPTTAIQVKGREVTSFLITPEDAGLERASLQAVKTGTAAENAARIRAVFAGNPGADRDFILVNAGAALLVVGKVSSLRSGVEAASECVDAGAALKTLDKYVAFTQKAGGGL